MKNIFIQILRVLMLFLLLISGVIGYIIYEDTLSEWWIPVGVALMIAVATFPFYMRWAWLTAGDNKIVITSQIPVRANANSASAIIRIR